jgi:hypothetical protein
MGYKDVSNRRGGEQTGISTRGFPDEDPLVDGELIRFTGCQGWSVLHSRPCTIGIAVSLKGRRVLTATT